MSATMNRKLLLGLLLLVAIGALAVLVRFEWTEVERTTGYSDEARRNPHLAAERLLQRYGTKLVKHYSLTLLDALPSTQEPVVITGSWRNLNSRRRQALDDWMRAGGHLIMQTDRSLGAILDEDTEIEFLPEYGVRLEWGKPNRDLSDLDDKARAESGEALPAWMEQILEGAGLMEACPGAQALSALPLTGAYQAEGQHAYLSLGSVYQLVYEGEHLQLAAHNRAGMQLAQIQVGDGQLTVLTSTWLWRNRDIGCYDNAYLLRFLAGSNTRLHWLYNTDMPSLWALLWQHYRLTLLLGLALLLGWIWYLLVRDGALRPTAEPERRSLLAHVEGAARFYWQQQGADLLLQALGEDLQQQLWRLHGKSASVQRQRDSLQAAAEQAGVTPAQLAWALSLAGLAELSVQPQSATAEQRLHQHSFTQVTDILQRIRQFL